MNILSNITKVLSKEVIQKSIVIWVGGAAIVGGMISGTRKCALIIKEDEVEYKNEMYERPIRGIYHTCRIAGHVGFGAFVAGGVALTAPLSIPAYAYWRRELDYKVKTNVA